jgi:hypothetical protein
VATSFLTSAAYAIEYKDYTPTKGVWQITTIKVKPSHIHNYLVGLKKSWVPAEELAKKHGIIDNYFVMVNPKIADPVGNVLIGEHYVNFASMDPNKARHMAMAKDRKQYTNKAEVLK